MKILPIYFTQSPNLRGNIPLKPNRVEAFADKLELSAKNNLSNIEILPQKYINMFRERFFRDYTPEEILNLKDRYAEIIKISDTEIFLNRVCQELKKDYNIENLPIKINTNYKKYDYKNDLSPIACCTPHFDKGFVEIKIDTRSQDKYSLLRIMAHELRHIVQTVKCYQHSSNQEYANALLEKYKNSGLFSHYTDKEIIELYIAPFVNSMVKFFEDLGIKKLEKTEPTYNFGRKILKSTKKDVNNNTKSYSDAYNEIDAKATGELICDLVHHFTKL